MKKTKKKEPKKDRTEEQRRSDAILAMITVGFLCGAILGGMAEGKLPAETYIAEFLKAYTESTEGPGLWRELWVTFRWPVGVILLSLLPVAGLTVPLLFFLRGFLLAYGITAMTAGSGLHGMLWAGLVYGPSCLLTVPVMFLLATECLLKKAAPEKEPKKLSKKLLWCVPALALCVFLDQSVIPPVLHFFLAAFETGA